MVDCEPHAVGTDHEQTHLPKVSPVLGCPAKACFRESESLRIDPLILMTEPMA